MEFHSKRARPAVGTNTEQTPLKRRALSVATASSSPPLASGNRSSVPRSSFLLTKNLPSSQRKRCEHTSSSSDEVDVALTAAPNSGASLSKKPAVHFKSSPAVDSLLFEAVSRYADTDTEQQQPDARNTKAENQAPAQQGVFGSSEDSVAVSPQAIESGYSLERRKSLSRHASFSSITRKQVVPHSDSIAQERCFDYLLQSIDEVWARYCNETSTAEVKVYDSMCQPKVTYPEPLSPITTDTCNSRILDSNSPRIVRTLSLTSINNKSKIASASSFSDVDSDDTSGYKSEATNPTEYETDCDYRKISNLPDSVRLQSLKDRLCRAKNDLESVHDSNSFDDCVKFWRRWDMIKYSAVEMMEEDDDDDIIETVIEELERGRYFTN
ncbi:LADA_0H00430g1_1 [Lachancea dasiensis]|uniref:LADA_0H00430g1_1 n=1 Tax=Lachancea dasiensis TaxID=1072105 RepID=A0A1G4JYS7_9SACH|nr:LADA_0H00430g1_1 [Lachancea dasiensis]